MKRYLHALHRASNPSRRNRAARPAEPAWAGFEAMESRLMMMGAPIAYDDFYEFNEDQALILTAAQGVLSNDDAMGGDLLAGLVTQPQHGSLTLNPDGSLVYTPNANYHGVDSFTYKAQKTTLAPEMFIVDQAASNVNFQITISIDTGILGIITRSDSDSSSVTGDILANMTPNQQPFSLAHVQQMNLTLAEAMDFDFNFGFLVGTLAVDTNANAITMNLDQVGPAAPVVGGNFTQTENTIHVSGIATLAATGLVASQIPPENLGEQQLDLVEPYDITGSIAQTGDQLTLTLPINFDGVFPLDGNNVQVKITGTVVARTTAYTVEDSNVATVLLLIDPVDDAPILGPDFYQVAANHPLNVPVDTTPVSQIISPRGASWRYLDNGSDQGTAWRNTLFDDSQWETGLAQLGYGDGDEVTLVDFIDTDAVAAGVQRNATTYFRREFYAGDISTIRSAVVRLLRDDGAAVYLNGQEILRDNLAPGAAYNTFSPVSIGGTDENTFYNFTIDHRLLLEGRNVLAVEVHQQSATSSDLSFDMELEVTRGLSGILKNDSDPDGDALIPTVVIQPQHGQLSLSPDGSFRYVPNPYFDGEDSFIYSLQGGSPPATADILPVSSVWKYLGDGSNQGTAWRAAGFNDSTWLQGLAELGYGDGDEVTVVPFIDTDPGTTGDQRNATTYFRSTFNVTSPSLVSNLKMQLKRDDAAAVYINGVEVYRDANLPANAAYNTFSTSTVADETIFIEIPLSAGVLSGGVNTIAAEVHQAASSSSDISFALGLTANVASGARVSLLVKPLNAGPTVQADESYTLSPGDTFSRDAQTGLVSTASDPDGDALMTVIVDPPNHGQLVLNLDGSYSYVASPSYFGSDSFSYRAIDLADQRLKTLVPAKSQWRYLDDGSNQGTAWRDPSYVDATWDLGVGEFGYGDGGEATIIDFGIDPANKYVTTYFRKQFTIQPGENFDLLLVSLQRDDGAAVFVNGVEVVRSNLAPNASAADLATASVSGTDEARYFDFLVPAHMLQEGGNVIAVEVHQSTVDSSDMSFDLKLTGIESRRTEFPLIPEGSIWRYLDDGSNQGTAWTGAGYDAAGWGVGVAQFGYGDGDEITLVGYGPDANNKHITTYFRTGFDVADASSVATLALRVKADDGVAVYLNGTRVALRNLPDGAAFNTPATTALANADEVVFFEFAIDPSLLVDGFNVLAAEVHQSAGTSSDMSFDLDLSATFFSDIATITFNTGLRGDFSQNGVIDGQDIEMLDNAIASLAHDPYYDLTLDTFVNLADKDELIHNILLTEYGDINLDQRVSIGDLVVLAEFFDLTGTANWNNGDLNGDSTVSIGDLVILAEHFGFGEPGGLTGDSAAGLQALGDDDANDDDETAGDYSHIADVLAELAG